MRKTLYLCHLLWIYPSPACSDWYLPLPQERGSIGSCLTWGLLSFPHPLTLLSLGAGDTRLLAPHDCFQTMIPHPVLKCQLWSSCPHAVVPLFLLVAIDRLPGHSPSFQKDFSWFIACLPSLLLPSVFGDFHIHLMTFLDPGLLDPSPLLPDGLASMLAAETSLPWLSQTS